MIDLQAAITQMSDQAQAIQALATGLSLKQARWKPDPDSWSILEVVTHLYDEEREDFRVRLKHVLEAKEGLPPGIDPAAWVTQRGYNQRDLADSLAAFLQEREQSLAWLRSLEAPHWANAVEGPFGRIHAGDLLAAWAAHDLLHIRQLTELRFALLKEQAQPFTLDYAGGW